MSTDQLLQVGANVLMDHQRIQCFRPVLRHFNTPVSGMQVINTYRGKADQPGSVSPTLSTHKTIGLTLLASQKPMNQLHMLGSSNEQSGVFEPPGHDNLNIDASERFIDIIEL